MFVGLVYKMIQYIAAGFDSENRRVILWRAGEYQYEIEIYENNSNKTKIQLEGEYYTALAKFTEMIVVNLDHEAHDDYVATISSVT